MVETYDKHKHYILHTRFYTNGNICEKIKLKIKKSGIYNNNDIIERKWYDNLGNILFYYGQKHEEINKYKNMFLCAELVVTCGTWFFRQN